MACLFPVHGYRSRERNPATGKRNTVYSMRKGLHDLAVTVPCGQCIACRLEKSRKWAIRSVKEASLYENNCVVTLTYDDENLPPSGSIVPEDAVLFMKRLRSRIDELCAENDLPPHKIRSYGCAEYGEKFQRPHYHIILYNWDFPDKQEDPEMDQREYKYYVSELLDEVWDKGRTQLMDLTFETSAYVARYVTKKLTGPRAKDYGLKRPEQPVCVSRRPGIGKPWYDKWKHEIYAMDRIYERGIPMRPPDYFDRRYEIEHPDQFHKIKVKRKSKSKIHYKKLLDYAYYRSIPTGMSEKICMEAKFQLLKRGFEKA